MSSTNNIQADHILDCKGLACPMPIVKTKKAMNELVPGKIMEVQATDKGSIADFQSWAKNTGHQYLGTLQEGDVMRHYLRKANPAEVKKEQIFSSTISHEELQAKCSGKENFICLMFVNPLNLRLNISLDLSTSLLANWRTDFLS